MKWKEDENYRKCDTFFSSSDVLSNWYQCQFTYKNINFNCVEQFMMFCKAKLFNDDDMAKKILSSNSPKMQKLYGRKVSNFIDDIWSIKASGYVYIGCREKFLQNSHLANVLLSTRGFIAEASPYDKIWGIGLSEQDPKALDPKNWKGQNKLGQILTKLRADLRCILENEEENTCSPSM